MQTDTFPCQQPALSYILCSFWIKAKDMLLFSWTFAVHHGHLKLWCVCCARKLSDGRKIIVSYILNRFKTPNSVVKLGWGCGPLSFIWPREFTRWLEDCQLTNKYGQRKRILPCDFLCSLTQRWRPVSEVLEITQCLRITRQCQRYGVRNQTSVQLFDLGKGGLTGWLAGWLTTQKYDETRALFATAWT